MASASETVQALRNTFASGKTQSLAFRQKQLKALLRLYEENQDAMIAALHKDLRKCKMEAVVTETQYLINDLKATIANFKQWAKTETPPKGFANIMDSLYVFNDPYGVVLVIGSWNYPIQLTLLPATGALAAGNCVLIKPSELSPASSKFMAETVPKYLDPDVFKVYEGGIPETTALLEQRFDYIFYTGATEVGRIIHRAANKHLTPVTLELGGKSPVYVDRSANIVTATKRILWGKFINAGQTCVAPDYLLCTPDVRDKFVNAAREVIKQFYGDDPQKSPDFGRIVNERHFRRVVGLLEGTNCAVGGNSDASDLYVAPTIVTDVKPTSPVMTSEIFGPILPVVTVADAAEAIKFINSREKPLALYIFSNISKDVELIIKNTSSGGLTVNDTIMQMATDLPFGGVGSSGFGRYHGRHTFDTFTHKKSCLYKNLGDLGEALASARYPPYSKGKLRYLNFLLGLGAPPSFKWLSYLLVFGLGLGASFWYKIVLKHFGLL